MKKEISIKIPVSNDLIIPAIPPHLIQEATRFQNFRQEELDITRDAFQANLANYMVKEDEKWKKISQDRLPDLSLRMKQLEKTSQIAADNTQSLSLQAKKVKISEEIDQINLKLDKFSKQKQDELSQQSSMEQQKVQLTQAINVEILEKYEQPSVTNKSSILYNWIIGCLYGSKGNVLEFCQQNKLKVEKPLSQPPENEQKRCLFACGGSKKPVRETVQVLDESFYAWQAVKQFIFQNNGADLISKLREFNALDIKPFQQMLTEELIYKKKSILSHVFEIDVKDQVRIFIEIVECFQNIIRSQKNTIGNASEKSEIKSLFSKLRKKQSEELTIMRLIDMLEKRQKNIKSLSRIVTNANHYISTKISEVTEKIINNDKETETIRNNIQSLDQQVNQELYTLQEEQRQAANRLLEEKYKELLRQQDEAHQKEIQKLKEIEKQDQNNQFKQQSNEFVVVQDIKKPILQEVQAIEQPEESNHDNENEMYYSDNDDDEEDGEDQGATMIPEQDPFRYNIQKMMFPHLLNNKQNKQKQTKSGCGLFRNTTKK